MEPLLHLAYQHDVVVIISLLLNSYPSARLFNGELTVSMTKTRGGDGICANAHQAYQSASGLRCWKPVPLL
eukprot:5392779-Amphidinium_carterae.1